MKESRSQWYHSEQFGAFWERTYRKRGISSMGGPSHEVIEIAQALTDGATVLDLGCGEGRNAYYLASLGFDVLAIDRSQAGIHKLRAICQESGVKINTLIADIGQFQFQKSYTLVMAHGVLYYLDKSMWQRLVRDAKTYTENDGFNIYTIFVFDEEFPCPDQFASAGYKGSFSSGEILREYEGWQILRYDRYVKWDEHPGVGEHYHPIEKLVAQKAKSDRDMFSRTTRELGNPLDPSLFISIKCGITSLELVSKCGQPKNVDKYSAFGRQYGVVQEIVEGYELELWNYGTHLFYLTNGIVSGRALLRTPFVQLDYRLKTNRNV